MQQSARCAKVESSAQGVLTLTKGIHMKKADILAATAHAGDPCAVFEIETRIGMKYCRLMTDAEIKQEDNSRYSHIRLHGGKSSVSIVFVQAVDTQGSYTNAYGEHPVKTFYDEFQRWGRTTVSDGARKMTDTKPVAHIKRCVNADQSFADFITAEFARQRQEEIDRQERDQQRRVAAHRQSEQLKELNERIMQLVGESPHMLWVDRSGDVDVKLDILTRLVDLAEQHATSTLTAGA